MLLIIKMLVHQLIEILRKQAINWDTISISNFATYTISNNIEEIKLNTCWTTFYPFFPKVLSDKVFFTNIIHTYKCTSINRRTFNEKPLKGLCLLKSEGHQGLFIFERKKFYYKKLPIYKEVGSLNCNTQTGYGVVPVS